MLVSLTDNLAFAWFRNFRWTVKLALIRSPPCKRMLSFFKIIIHFLVLEVKYLLAKPITWLLIVIIQTFYCYTVCFVVNVIFSGCAGCRGPSTRCPTRLITSHMQELAVAKIVLLVANVKFKKTHRSTLRKTL